MEGFSDRTPFKEPLNTHEVSPKNDISYFEAEKLLKIGNDDQHVIRAHTYDSLSWREGTYLTLQEIASNAQRLFNELNEQVVSAPVQFVIGERAGEKTIYCIAPQIIPADQDSLESEKAKREFIEMRDKLCDYLVAKYEADDFYPYDIIGEHQYLYGKQRGDEENRWYLIDVDPYIRKMGKHPWTLKSELTQIGTEIQKYEDVQGVPALLQKIDDIIATLSTSD